MHEIMNFLQKSGVFYLATTDGQLPRIRPFGAVSEHEGKLYICTNSTKEVSRQMKANPRVEISAMVGGDWIRFAGSVAVDERREAKAAMLAQNPDLQAMYNVDDGIFEVFYFKEGQANIVSFQGRNDTYSI